MLTKVLRDILVTIEELNGKEKNRYIDDQEIANKLGLPIQKVRDFLEHLGESGYVKLINTFGGSSALTTPRARIELQDPKVLSPDTSQATIVLSGVFQNSILNIDSTLTSLNQTINNRNADPMVILELEQLVQQLNNDLKQVSPDYVDDAEAVAQAAKDYVNSATKQKPNKLTMEISKEGLLKAAKNIARVMPTVLEIATQIITVIQKLN